MTTKERLEEILRQRIMVFDGAMGSMIQGYGLTDKDFRGERFANHPHPLQGCNDLLCITQPQIIEEIHRRFLEAGADIIETNTFNATSISLADYKLEDAVYEINLRAAQIARKVADEFTAKTPDKPRFVAGSMGPTSRTASLSPQVNNPAFRAITFDELVEAYTEQVRGLVDGGVDILLPETTFDTLNLKAALYAIEKYLKEHDLDIPVIASVTISDKSGRTLSGQTLEAFSISIEHANLFSVSMNCALGAKEMRPHIRELHGLTSTYLTCYPNAGLPNEFGEYDDTPESMSEVLGEFAREGWLNIVGGCCGTRPEHIKAIAEAVKGVKPRVIPKPKHVSRFSGMDAQVMDEDSTFFMIGERTNVMGSRRFARLIRTKDYETALSIARQQVQAGANILDVNMDEGLLDSAEEMKNFLNLLMSDPEIASIPIMIDSSDFDVILAGLKVLQGKSIVNSISLKEGEEIFKERARTIKMYGAAVVVMAFDEEGQATTKERKVSILSRAYKILTEEVGFKPEDIIFDPNVLTVATGMEEHNDYALAFIEATRELKKRFPRAKISGGISNISFSFRGNNVIREAMHSVFLYHAIKAGLDMGIVNAGQLAIYEDIEPELREKIEDVLFNRHPGATEALIAYAEKVKGQKKKVEQKQEKWRELPLSERLAYAIQHGVIEHLEEDLKEALEHYDQALEIIEGPLLDGMNIVGDLFGAGKMFLPQVVKSARVMKKAVSFLSPYMEEEKDANAGARGKILMATVKGDVHDIGKNIVSVVLGCNNYEIIDLGVMVATDEIVKQALEQKVDIIGLSGLITPSLDEMVRVAKELQRVGANIPLLIGGATTSKKHTAIKIAPEYDAPVVYVRDASRSVNIVNNLLQADLKEDFIRTLKEKQQQTRERHAQALKNPIIPYQAAIKKRFQTEWTQELIAQPNSLGKKELLNFPLEKLVDYIDWTPFFHSWELKGRYPEILESPKNGKVARELFENAQKLLQKIVKEQLLTANAVYGFFPANSDGDDIVLFTDETRTKELMRFHTLRQQKKKREDAPSYALADFIAPLDSNISDYIGAFVLTTGLGLEKLIADFEAEQDDYNSILAQSLADRLAEAFAEYLHELAREECGLGKVGELSKEELLKEKYRGIRPAAGYPAYPDHTEKALIFDLLDAEKITGVSLTENFAMYPTAAISGLYFNHPQARYFAVGYLGQDQIKNYSQRKKMSVEEIEKWLAPYLHYA